MEREGNRVNSVFSRMALPLLGKELTERAARKRTYIVRFIFAALLCVAFGFLTNDAQETLNNGIRSNLGSGSMLFEGLIHFQIVGIFFFLPAVAAGQLALEKERDSLALLFLTRLGPWQILFEKYLSALVPIFSLLLLAMPMAAIAYAYGGVTQSNIGWGIYTLALLAFQVAALALMCSAWCRTTTGAFVATYFLGALLYFSAPVAENFVTFLTFHRPSRPDTWLRWAACVYPPAIADYLKWTRKSLLLVNAPSWISTALFLLIANVPAWISIALFLGLARFFLVRRAFIKGKSPALLFFQWLDRFMQRLNRFAGNVQFGKRGRSLPGAHPIAWREVQRNVLARPHYLLRILVLLEVPTFGLGLMQVYGGTGKGLVVLIGMLSTMAVLAISVNAANAFVSERVQQTLDVLLTTPLSAREIVQQKARAMYRLLFVTAVPLLTLVIMEWFLRQPNFVSPYRDSTTVNLISSLLTLATFLPLVLWLSLWIGLKTKTRLGAILNALGVLVLWCIGPIILGFFLLARYPDQPAKTWRWLMGVSPVFVPMVNECSSLHEIGNPWAVVTINIAFYGGLVWLIRWRCLSRADYYLRRANKG